MHRSALYFSQGSLYSFSERFRNYMYGVYDNKAPVALLNRSVPNSVYRALCDYQKMLGFKGTELTIKG